MLTHITNDTGAVKRSYILAFLTCLLLIAVVGYGYYIHHKQIIMDQSRNELAAIADLKAGQIRQWRQERLNDASVIQNNDMLAHRLSEYLVGKATAEVLLEFKLWMKSLRLNRYLYADLLKPNGELLVSGQEGKKYSPPDPMHQRMIDAAVRDNKVVFSDLHKDGTDGAICINLIIPILHHNKKNTRPLAVLMLDIDPKDYLYPLIKVWPNPSPTAETLLVERSGDDVFFLNELRHMENTALSLRRPLTDRSMPAVRAALGEEGVFEGADYRRTAVLAATRSISGSPWAIVAKIDTAEISAPVERRAWLVACASLVTLFVSGLGLYLLWIRKNEQNLRVQYETELKFNTEIAVAAAKLKELNNELEQRVEDRTTELLLEQNNFKNILEAMNNSVYIVNQEYRIVYANTALLNEFGPVAGRTCHEYLHGRDEICPWCKNVEVFAGKTVRREWTSEKNGKTYETLDSPIKNVDGTNNKLAILHDVTERKAAEETINRYNEELELKVLERTQRLENLFSRLNAINQELHISRNKFTSLFELANDAIFIVDFSGNIIDVNRTGCERLGYSREELISTPVALIDTPKFAEKIPERMQQLMASESIMFETVHIRKNGTTMPVEVCASKVEMEGRQLILSSARDITKRAIAEEKLLTLSRAVENSPATVVITDKAGVIEYVNPKFTEISGYTATEAIGSNPRILSARQQPPEFYTELWQTILDGMEWRGEFCNLKKNGEIHWEKASISPIRDDEGNITHFVAVKEDITEWKRATEELQRAKIAADAANRSKSEFLANMSHEIRTPLNAIIGFSSLALKNELSPRQQDYINKINTAGESLLNIINDILDFSKIEAGKLQMEETLFRLEDTLYNSISVVQQKALEKNLTLLLDPSANFPPLLIGDAHRLSQVIANLLGNAIKFTEQGEVKLSVSILEQNRSRLKLLFSVHDTGIGLSREQIPKLFQPFTQADGSTTRKFGGTGLGLSISRQLVEMMSGEIWCESTLGEGSSFSFTACFGCGDKLSAAVMPPAQLNPPDSSRRVHNFSGARILLVEDNEINQQLVIEILRNTGAVVNVAENGQVAVNMITTPGRYDLVLMDIQMPVMDGYEATRRIRSEQQFASLPIIAMTAYAMEEEKQRIAEIGIEDYITKPIDARIMLNIISRYLHNAGSAVNPECSQLLAPSVETNLPYMPGIDCAGALARIDGNVELYLWILQSFVDNHSDSAELLKNALQEANMELAQRTAHTVKGIAGTIGASRLQEICRQFVTALAKSELQDTIHELLNRYTVEIEQTVRTLLKALPLKNISTDIKSAASIDPPGIDSALITLRGYIRERDGRAERYLDDFEDILADLSCDHLDQLRKYLGSFDFDGADISLTALAAQQGICLSAKDSGAAS